MGITRVKNISIQNFRCFSGVSFDFGKHITAISGQNATGKSTILALLGHSSELKIKDGKPILAKQFRTEFSEIIIASQQFDIIEPLVYSLQFVDDGTTSLKLSFRSTWQKHKIGKRFRLIPKKTPDRNTEKKHEWPILYLGLSRLFPIGESKLLKSSRLNIKDNYIQNLLLTHRDILSLNELPLGCSAISMNETSKITVGVNTDKYDHFANSAGQDNLNQIILAVMSFESLKERQGEAWSGGLLLIDELDTALHPAAQEKLLRYLYQAARRLDLQIVFTTHSLTMLKFVCERTKHNDSDELNNYQLIYFTTRNNYLEKITNPDYEFVYNELLNKVSIIPDKYRKITIYTEDDEARWFLHKNLNLYSPYVKSPVLKLGCNDLLSLLENDFQHFQNILFIFDGDVEEEVLLRSAKKIGLRNTIAPNVIKLPGEKRPEQVFYDYLASLPNNHDLFLNDLSHTNLSKRTLRECGPFSSCYDGLEERLKFKKWFNDYIILFDITYKYWAIDNAEQVDDFIKTFRTAYNIIAENLWLPKLPTL